MLNLYLRHGLFVGCCLFLLLTTLYAHSAVTLDRTRIVFSGDERAINIRSRMIILKKLIWHKAG